MSTLIASRLFGVREQDDFAHASGDFNPMHMDPVAARRTQAGASVVHGMHAALWAVDMLIERGLIVHPIHSMEVAFQHFIYVGSTTTLHVTHSTETTLMAALMADGVKTSAIAINYDTSVVQSEPLPIVSTATVPKAPLELHIVDLPNRVGRLPVPSDLPTARMFPRAADLLGAARVAAIAQLSTLVGMVCPGLHSILRKASIRIIDTEDPLGGIVFRVRSCDERFRMVNVDAGGSGIRAAITAFVRQPPVDQPGLLELAETVKAGEFAGTTALVIGGSRGIGALTARAIASGGGRVIVTYLVGQDEARAIAAELGSERCRVMRYDAREAAWPQLAALDWKVNQLYYFASSQILRQTATVYSVGRFAAFCDVYVNGFEAACMALRTSGVEHLAIFYPSSLTVEDRPAGMTEYTMAKAAGEVLCADMSRVLRGFRFIVRRLPRILTDQTATVVPVRSADPVTVMLPIIREMHVS